MYTSGGLGQGALTICDGTASSSSSVAPPGATSTGIFYIGDDDNNGYEDDSITEEVHDDDDEDEAEFPATDPRSSAQARPRNATGMGSMRYLRNTLLFVVAGIMALIPHTDARDITVASTMVACACMDNSTIDDLICGSSYHIYMQARGTITTMHSVSGKHVHGLIVDPGAASAIMGT